MDWPQYGPQKLKPLEYLYEKIQKRYKEKKGPTPPKKIKTMILTSHAASMHLVIQLSSDRVIPRERLGPFPQLFMGTSAKQRTEQLVAHGQMVENLQHLYQHGDGHREQHNGL